MATTGAPTRIIIVTSHVVTAVVIAVVTAVVAVVALGAVRLGFDAPLLW